MDKSRRAPSPVREVPPSLVTLEVPLPPAHTLADVRARGSRRPSLAALDRRVATLDKKSHAA